MAGRVRDAVLAQPRVKRLLSSDHFSVDGTLIQAWASLKSFRPKEGVPPPTDGDGNVGGGRNVAGDFKGQRRSNETHAPTTAPDALLYCQGTGQEGGHAYNGPGQREKRSGRGVDTRQQKGAGS